jgi:DNA invertase Pin-like site-specific DNA recombinase
MAPKAIHQRFISYLRVSTVAQGRSGLGLEAQRSAVEAHVRSVPGGMVLAEFVEVESGKDNGRVKLQAALERCKVTGATLVIAKLDRLSRNAAFLLTLRDAGVRFVAADMPQADNLTVGIMAVVAEQERHMTSERTKAALAAAKARGVKLGNPQGFAGKVYREGGKAVAVQAAGFAKSLASTVRPLVAQGLSLRAIAAELDSLGVRTARGGSWSAQAVKNLVERMDE